MPPWSPWDRVRAVAVDETAGPDRLLAALAAVDAAHEHIERTEADLLRRARAAGLTWREIAQAMGLGSPQAASQRAHRRSDHGLARPGDTLPDEAGPER